jgi:hypothetical protein
VLPRIMALLMMLMGVAYAHPVDEIVQGAYVTLMPGKVLLELDITPGSAVSGAVLNVLDADGDKNISTAETEVYAGLIIKQLSLFIDNVDTAWSLESVSVPPYTSLQSATDTLKILAFAARDDATGPHTFRFTNNYQPAQSSYGANVFLRPCDGWIFQIMEQKHSDDGRQLTVSFEQIEE